MLQLNSVGVNAAVKTFLQGALGVLVDNLESVEAGSATTASVASSDKASPLRLSVADTKSVSKYAVEVIGVWGGKFSGVATGVALPLADMGASKDFYTWGVDGGSGGEIVRYLGFWGHV